MILDPAKLGISMVVAVVLLIGGVMALAKEDPSLVIDPKQQSPVVASESSVPTQATTTEQVIAPQTDAGSTAEQKIDQESIPDSDTMDMEEMTESLENFDPITSGDWSLDNLSDKNLGVN